MRERVDSDGRARGAENVQVESRRVWRREARGERVVMRESKVCVVCRSWRLRLVTCIVGLERKR